MDIGLEAMEHCNSTGRSPSDNCVCYGPIRYFARKTKAPTLSTGRKSKFEPLDGEEETKRELRRQKNRLLSQQLKEKREKIVVDLLTSINQLEQEQNQLFNYIKQLKGHRDDLVHAIEDMQQDPLTNLLNHKDLLLFFEQYDHQDCDTDILLSTLNN